VTRRVLLALVGLVFLVAAGAKVLDGGLAAAVVAKMTGSNGVARALVALATGVEAGLGILLVLRGSVLDARLGLAVLVVFTAWLAWMNAVIGFGTPCGCQVPFLGDRGWAPLLRNAAMLAVCWWGARRPDPAP
jgi:hypothetical protein